MAGGTARGLPRPWLTLPSPFLRIAWLSRASTSSRSSIICRSHRLAHFRFHPRFGIGTGWCGLSAGSTSCAWISPTRRRATPTYLRTSIVIIPTRRRRSEEHTSELQSRLHLVCRLLLEKKKKRLHVISLNYVICS